MRMIAAGAGGYLHKWCIRHELIEAIRVVHGGKLHFHAAILNSRHAAPALTPREIKVLELIAAGLSIKQVASRLGISVNTVKTHRMHLRAKLALDNDVQLADYAIAHGHKRILPDR